MKRADRIPWVFVLVLFGALVVQRSCFQISAIDPAEEDITAAQDSIVVLTRVLSSALEREALAATLAAQSDTVLVRVVERVEVETAQAVALAISSELVFASAVDSLRARVDTTGNRLLDQIVTGHETRVEADSTKYDALEVRLGATEASAGLWQGLAFDRLAVMDAQAATIGQWEISDASKDIVIAGLRSSQRTLKVGGGAGVLLLIVGLVSLR